VRRRRWFLPDTPDLVGLLRAQLAVTIEGVDAFASWAAGDAGAAEAVRAAEARGDAAKRRLLEELRAAFVTPMEPEDTFALSRSIDWILNHAVNLIDESDAMAIGPDDGLAAMATLVGEALRHIDAAIERLQADADGAVEAADAAIAAERRLERTYFGLMADSLAVEGRTERIARRELYRRCAGIGEVVIDVAERVVYAVVKQS
jgi:uncharacterized protein Yka (UPF0111/DUF47 family)